jgi:hypothetical protein
MLIHSPFVNAVRELPLLSCLSLLGRVSLTLGGAAAFCFVKLCRKHRRNSNAAKSCYRKGASLNLN